MAAPPAVSIRRVHAEPERDPVAPAEALTEEVGWLALWEDGAITYHPSARALVRQRDQRDAVRAERRGAPAIIATVITWNRTPPGSSRPRWAHACRAYPSRWRGGAVPRWRVYRGGHRCTASAWFENPRSRSTRCCCTVAD